MFFNEKCYLLSSIRLCLLHVFLFTGSTPMFTSVFQYWYFPFCPLCFQQKANSPSLLKASRSNPHPFFQTAFKMTSCRCIVAGPVSAQKSNVYYFLIGMFFLVLWDPKFLFLCLFFAFSSLVLFASFLLLLLLLYLFHVLSFGPRANPMKLLLHSRERK